MKNNSVLDYSAYTLLRIFGPVIRVLPLGFGLAVGSLLGRLWYRVDFKHRSVVYANLKTAFAGTHTISDIRQITREFYSTFAQNIMEIFFIPLIDKKYVSKYVTFQGLDHVDEVFKRGKGTIMVGMHEGNWELSNILSANLGFPFFMFAQEQRMPMLGKLLNEYRRLKGCQFIQKENQLRHLIRIFRENQSVGMSIDLGGKTGVGVDFFGKDASMSIGSIKLALKYDVSILPVFSYRIRGHYKKIIIEKPFELVKTGNEEADIRDNLQRLVKIFEGYIRQHPNEYLWTYKVWKYSRERNILVLSDQKTGHLRQSEAVSVAAAAALLRRGIKARISKIEIKYKSSLSRIGMDLSSCFSGKYGCQGCLWCFKWFLSADTRKKLEGVKPDIVISCGSSLAAVNLALSRENLAKSIVIMRPSFLPVEKFDLAIIPRHDHPESKKNILVTRGALNLISQEYLKEQSAGLIKSGRGLLDLNNPYIGLLIGGDTKDFTLDQKTMKTVSDQVKALARDSNAGILVTTSRRTSPDIEKLIKDEFGAYPDCKLLIIANENNIPEAVGGILGLSRLVIVSPESISMVSESASAGRYILVFNSRVNKRHHFFLGQMTDDKLIYLAQPDKLSVLGRQLWKETPAIQQLDDLTKIEEHLSKII